jgi:hypothetical protein
VHPIADAAWRAYRAGLCPLPVRDDGLKAPAVSEWRSFQTTRPTVEQMRAWDFDHRSGFGVLGGHLDPWDFDCPDTYHAFVAGAVSGGLGDVVDRIRAGFEAETPGGGRRWLVHNPAGLIFEDTVLAARPRLDSEPPRPKVKTLIEIVTFAIVPPSNGRVHPSGRPYVQLTGGFDTIAHYTADERDALKALARSFDQRPRPEAFRRAGHQSGTIDSSRPGDDYNRRIALSSLLEPFGWVHVFDRGEVEYWRRPGKTRGISATFNFGRSNLFYPFTSSTEFDPDKSYSKFAVYAILHHGGDFEAASRALAAQGFGQRHDQSRPPPPSPARVATWRWLSDVNRTSVDWLWPKRLARRTLTLMIGDTGLGKSRVTHDLTARITTGASWPDAGAAPIGNVVILSAEDDASYTIRPAIEAANGDLSKVAILEAVQDAQGNTRTFNLGTDLTALDELLDITAAA